jgi:hypothetical protein
MRRWCALVAAGFAAAGAAWAADAAIDGGPSGAAAFYAPSDYNPATLELKWDTGTRKWSVAWFTGAGAWVGNDFDTRTTLKTTHVKILKLRLYTRDNWPNRVWDGFRVGVFAFAGGVPGSRLWPASGGGYYFKPSGGPGHVWAECPVNWVCPAPGFMAAQQQYYNWPNCDPWAVDDNATFRERSWNYYGGAWSPLSNALLDIKPYYNLMLRVRVETGHTSPGVEPSSIGRVKALYY